MNDPVTNSAPQYDPFNPMIEKRIPIISITEMERILVQKMAERFKEINPDVAKKIDAAAARITGLPWAKTVISDRDPELGSPDSRPAICIESDAGQGKTFIVRSAFKKFCEISGMNFVENPAEHYIPTKKDAYFFSVNMIGQHNASEAGGLPQRVTLGGGRVEGSLINELLGRADQVCRMTRDTLSSRTYENGALDVVQIDCEFKKPGVAGSTANSLRDWMVEVLETSGSKLNVLSDGAPLADDKFSVKFDVSDQRLRVTYYEPKQEIRAMAAMGKLPNIAWAKASAAGCCCMFIDEIDKISPAIRHLLLEVAQFGRVAGTANLGENYMVVMAGNLGDRGDFNDFNDSMSAATIAETTRSMRFRVCVTPQEWAQYIETCYPGSDNAHFPSFIKIKGSQAGIFRPNYEKDQFDPHFPVANSRSLEAAMKAVKQLFLMADRSGGSREDVMPQVRTLTLAMIGADASNAYEAHVNEMNTMAIPLAEHIMAAEDESFDAVENRKLDFPGAQGMGFLDLMTEKTGQFSYLSPDAQEFAHRFQSALVNIGVRDFLKTDNEKERIEIVSKVIAGLGVLRGELTNTGITALRTRLVNVGCGDELTAIMSKAIPRGIASGFYGDANASAKEQKAQIEEMIDNMINTYVGLDIGNAPRSGR